MALDETGKPVRQPEAFDDLFAREWPRLVRIAQQITHSASRSEEVAQEVFLAFYRRFGDMLPERPAAWLHRAAAHGALNAVRGGERRRLREQRDARMAVPSAPDPGELVAAREEIRAVRAALGRIGENQATLLALRYGGLSYNEIAQAMGVRVGQIGTRLRRAELRLRKEMDHAPRK